jgi:phosphinothricin acetyltransferase
MQIRLATLDDAAAIRAIYNLEVETSTATFDLVGRSSRTSARGSRPARGVLGGGGRAGRRGGRVRLAVAVQGASGLPTTVEDSVYVRRDQQGRGVGRALLTYVVDLAAASGFHAVMARIEGGSEASRALHAACGFELVGIEREVGRKFGRWLDIALMQRLLSDR